jgi:hypothetical protein
MNGIVVAWGTFLECRCAKIVRHGRKELAWSLGCTTAGLLRLEGTPSSLGGHFPKRGRVPGGGDNLLGAKSPVERSPRRGELSPEEQSHPEG